MTNHYHVSLINDASNTLDDETTIIETEVVLGDTLLDGDVNALVEYSRWLESLAYHRLYAGINDQVFGKTRLVEHTETSTWDEGDDYTYRDYWKFTESGFGDGFRTYEYLIHNCCNPTCVPGTRVTHEYYDEEVE